MSPGPEEWEGASSDLQADRGQVGGAERKPVGWEPSGEEGQTQ